ncbi:mannosyl-glycoprotein endo-beta-N-acetylglucosamidase [Campylobacter sp. MIT 12-5580]|uniref:glucosaminidase domain-containing protein n=1 Tax=Campylobacter sp. MIT 12-5580 TaxID=2040651 RepID=UPI0010F4B23C|nr:glucosaminidase domain-containing protein [Campylobacter sp. MIT 12-5580]TKX30381.1 mannosyl-glycoprotein endo-beta-N-acetylglucosamidase [Campylobacter sp. MIT 12-5580]
MKPSIIFLKLCLPIFVLAFEAGFHKEYYKLSTDEKRKVFIEKIDTLLDHSFEKVAQEQAFIKNFFETHAKAGFRNISKTELQTLIALKEKYRVKNLFDFKEYQKRIGVVPKSMGIAQALVESGTGTSRFAREANNLFGEWTWGEKGLVPKHRKRGKTHKIKIFDSLQESVDSYLLNLNRHFAYEEFRTKRFKTLQEGREFKGLEAIKTLHNYSEIKGEYEKILKNVIEKYKLYLLD